MFASSSLCSVFTSGDVSAGSVSTLNSNGGSKSCTVPSSALKKNQQLVNIVSYVAVLSFCHSVLGGMLRDDTKNSCVGDYSQ